LHLRGIFAPDLKRRVPIGILLKVQTQFHAVIRGRAEKEVRQHGLRLPELEPMLEFDDLRVWFSVPGMYGGFITSLAFGGRCREAGVRPSMGSVGDAYGAMCESFFATLECELLAYDWAGSSSTSVRNFRSQWSAFARHDPCYRTKRPGKIISRALVAKANEH
jgi:hypothetical protein